jgi:hypothetical protein
MDSENLSNRPVDQSLTGLSIGIYEKKAKKEERRNEY